MILKFRWSVDSGTDALQKFGIFLGTLFMLMLRSFLVATLFTMSVFCCVGCSTETNNDPIPPTDPAPRPNAGGATEDSPVAPAPD